MGKLPLQATRKASRKAKALFLQCHNHWSTQEQVLVFPLFVLGLQAPSSGAAPTQRESTQITMLDHPGKLKRGRWVLNPSVFKKEHLLTPGHPLHWTLDY